MPRLFLLLVALTFAGFGLWGLAAPERLAGVVGWDLRGPDAVTEIRAFYGGLELGIGAFLMSCAARRRRVDLGLRLAAWALGGSGLVRLTSIAVEGREGWDMPAVAAAELLAAAAALALIGRSGEQSA
jgi:hypothetical protein